MTDKKKKPKNPKLISVAIKFEIGKDILEIEFPKKIIKKFKVESSIFTQE